MADDDQKKIIDTWLLDWWWEVKEDFIYDHVKFCKISGNEAAKVFTGEIINFNGDTEVGTN